MWLSEYRFMLICIHLLKFPVFYSDNQFRNATRHLLDILALSFGHTVRADVKTQLKRSAIKVLKLFALRRSRTLNRLTLKKVEDGSLKRNKKKVNFVLSDNNS